MANERILKLADELLLLATAGDHRIITHSCNAARKKLAPIASESEVRVSVDLLLKHELLKRTSEEGRLDITLAGISAAGSLQAYLAQVELERKTAHKANEATVESAETMKLQLEQAVAAADRSHRWSIWSIVAAVISAVAAVWSAWHGK
jgi:hypothetical protein